MLMINREITCVAVCYSVAEEYADDLRPRTSEVSLELMNFYCCDP
jgi:hypothetical protein